MFDKRPLPPDCKNKQATARERSSTAYDFISQAVNDLISAAINTCKAAALETETSSGHVNFNSES